MVKEKLFREYIGAMDKRVNFSDVPINPNVVFHFIIAFAVDYTFTAPPAQAYGQFIMFWDTLRLTPNAINEVKRNHPNVKFVLALGGASVNGPKGETTSPVKFNAGDSVDGWVSRAINSLRPIITDYGIEGIDIDYEEFTNENDANTFAQCIGKLITTLKGGNIIKFASIAPYNIGTVQRMYRELWQRYSSHIDYVNFQFYANKQNTNAADYIASYNEQVQNYGPDKILASFSTGAPDPNVILPHVGLEACRILKNENKLNGIFVWSADASYFLGNNFHRELEAQQILVGP